MFFEVATGKPMKTQRKKRDRSRVKTVKTRVKKFPTEDMEGIVARAKDIAEPLCEAEGIELVHVELSSSIFRFYIDKTGGVTLDDCVNISRQLNSLMDVSFEINRPYRLEVSSPGHNRPLGKRLDFERFKGRVARIRVAQSVDGQKKFKGVLLGISEGIVKLLVDDKTVAIPYQEIIKARLEP